MELLSKSADRNSPYAIIGKILGPHSLRGALQVHSLSDFPEHFLELEEVYLLSDPDSSQPVGRYRIESAQPYKAQRFLLMLEGVEDRTAAEALSKCYLAIPLEEAPELPEDTYYVRDLIGFEVRDASGKVLGKVVHIVQSHQDLIVLQTPDQQEHWIPFVHELVPVVNTSAGYLEIAPIAGLIEDPAEP